MVSMNQPIYLDHNATTPLLPEVIDAMLPYLREHFGNPSSGHVFGQRAREAVDQAREQVAGLLACDPGEIVFTSGGTEANNLAIRGVAEALPTRRHLVTTVIEHPATTRPVRWLEQQGWAVTWLEVSAEGRARPADLVNAIQKETVLVTVMHANNETGVLQPLGELCQLAHERGILVHTDAAQSAGKVPIEVNLLGVDLLSIAGHKLYAPKGVGALYVRRGTPLQPLVRGAGHERGIRPGTENVASLVGLGVACVVARRELECEAVRLTGLREHLWHRLKDAIPGMVLHGHPTARLPNTLNLRFPGVKGSALLARCPGVAASTGSACHDGHESASSVITAMGISPEEALGAVRLTLGRATATQDVEAAALALVAAWRLVCAEP